MVGNQWTCMVKNSNQRHGGKICQYAGRWGFYSLWRREREGMAISLIKTLTVKHRSKNRNLKREGNVKVFQEERRESDPRKFSEVPSCRGAHERVMVQVWFYQRIRAERLLNATILSWNMRRCLWWKYSHAPWRHTAIVWVESQHSTWHPVLNMHLQRFQQNKNLALAISHCDTWNSPGHSEMSKSIISHFWPGSF